MEHNHRITDVIISENYILVSGKILFHILKMMEDIFISDNIFLLKKPFPVFILELFQKELRK